MPQKFLHLNCFFTCGITASNFETFCSIVLAVGGRTPAPKTSASFVRARRALIAFASLELFVLVIAVPRPQSDSTHDTPYHQLSYRRRYLRRPPVSVHVRWV